MLRIEKVFLQGFKSFCDPTEVVFDEEGITAVVGPNGCGKSNISDAVSWVIGEQRARALRGGKMEDVIFQGSRNRSASGMAEVILTMVVRETFEIRAEKSEPPSSDAVSRPPVATEKLPAPPIEATESEAVTTTDRSKARRKFTAEDASRVFQEGERITVGRRLYRTGESEYEMNGRTCRLRDIQDLFAGTGLGGAHYAIIEQGRIGQVLSAKPFDRRALIEEAAGVSKFKMRQHAAELKLEASKQNLARLTDILAEIERQQNSLKRQAARARRYQRLRQEMRDLMGAVYATDYRITHAALTKLESTWSAISLREAQVQTRIIELEGKQASAVQEARIAEEQLNETRQAATSIDLETERTGQHHTRLADQLRSLSARSEQLTRDREAITHRSSMVEEEITRLREELRALEQEINTASSALTADEEAHRASLKQDTEAEQRLEAVRQKLYEATTHLERWRQLKRQSTEAVDRAELRRQGLGIEHERTQAQAQVNEQTQASLRINLAKCEEHQNSTNAKLIELRSALVAAYESCEMRRSALSAAQRELTAIEHRLKSLIELDERHAYFSEAVQFLLNRKDGDAFKTLGTLADFLHVAPDYEAMIETALRDELQYVLVPSFDDAQRAINFLKTQGQGRATFMVVGLHGADHPAAIINSGESASEPDEFGFESPRQSLKDSLINTGEAHSLVSLLGLQSEFASTFEQALPHLAAARIIETVEQALEASLSEDEPDITATYLTRSGERIAAGRLVTGGSNTHSGTGVLALKREITELTERFRVMSATAVTAEAELQLAEDKLSELNARRSEFETGLHQIEKELAVLREQWQHSERERERIATHLRIIVQETAQIEQELVEYQDKLAHATSRTEEAERMHAEVEKAVSTAQTEVVELRRKTEVRAQEIARRRADFAAQVERRRGSQHDLHRLENEAQDIDGRLNRSHLETKTVEEQIKSLQSNLASIATQLEQLTTQQTEMAISLSEQTTALTMARERVAIFEADIRAAREEATQAREERANLELERVRLTSALSHIAESCSNELGEQITELIERFEKADALPPSASSLIEEQLAGDEEAEESIENEANATFLLVPEDFNLESAKARLDELRSKIDSLGPINMMALEELTEVEERHHFLSTQKADIEQAVADMQAAIAEIKRRSRERFQEAFQAINANFSMMFQELFGGGRGEMRLIDESDILESGIEIIAQPPGKRLQNVLLLSGGEKAMTAISLVLAIFRYRPSPFCILDEVDAPLDEINIGRFTDKVVEMSSQTQFMIITHNKRTMEAAQTLYGVTMEDPGISKLVSVRLT